VISGNEVEGASTGVGILSPIIKPDTLRHVKALLNHIAWSWVNICKVKIVVFQEINLKWLFLSILFSVLEGLSIFV